MAIAAIAWADAAHAARIATPAIVVPGGQDWYCAVTYLGASQTPVRVLVTRNGGPLGLINQATLSVSGKDALRVGITQGPCFSASSARCEPIFCVFNYTVPAADVRGSLCVTKGDNAPPVCVEAR